MRKYRIGITCFLASLLVVFVAGCGQETVTLPGVVSVTPAQGATNVVTSTTVTATFSLAMSPSTISSSTFTLTGPGGIAVPGAVSYSGNVATFTPTAALAYRTTYTATVANGVATSGGAALLGNYVWSFTTLSPSALGVTVTPAPFAQNVALTATISATFSQAMNCATLASPATTFTVADPGGTAVNGTVTCSGSIATFTPAGGALALYGTTYTATISTGATDLQGAPLAGGNYIWSFTTLFPTALGVTVTPAPFAQNVALTATISATFSQAINCATLASPATTFTVAGPGGTAVNGTVTCSGSVATFTPVGGALALYNTTYTATITTGATDLQGSSLAGGNYVWTFTTIPLPPVVTPAPTVIATIPVSPPLPEDVIVPLNQAINATFSEPMDAGTIISANFSLTGPGGTVPGSVSYAASGNELLFQPSANLDPGDTYVATITGGANGVLSAGGQPMAANYTWTFMTGTIVNTIAPELVRTFPGNTAVGVEATNVPLNQAVSATFTEAMNPLTLNTATYLLYTGTTASGTPLPATITYNDATFIATLTPTAMLTANTTYTATVTNGATDLAGNPLGTTVPSPYTNPWTFTTGAAATPPPVVLGPFLLPFGGFGGGAGMTSQGIHTVINGDIGTTGASTTMTGFYDESVAAVAGVYPCSYTVTPSNMGLVNGTIDTAPPPPSGACPNEGTANTFAIATEAAGEAQTAYTTLQGLPSTGVLAAELGDTTIYPGVYTNASAVGITLGNLTLDAQGNPNASWVFQIGSSLTVGTPTAPESVILINGAQAKNVFWAVGGLPGAVINYGGGGTMVGTIISQPGITVSSPGVAAITTINGRVIALDASTTIVNTVINVPAP